MGYQWSVLKSYTSLTECGCELSSLHMAEWSTLYLDLRFSSKQAGINTSDNRISIIEKLAM